MSIADISAYFEIHFLNLVNYDFKKLEKLNKWMQEMEKFN
jgi:hypothetical protein